MDDEGAQGSQQPGSASEDPAAQDTSGAGSTGKLVHEVGYKVKVGLLNVYGPAELDPEHDPVQQLKREHEREQAGPDTEAREEELRQIRESGQ